MNWWETGNTAEIVTRIQELIYDTYPPEWSCHTQIENLAGGGFRLTIVASPDAIPDRRFQLKPKV